MEVFLFVSAVKHRACGSLLVLKHAQRENHELLAVVLRDGVELLNDQVFNGLGVADVRCFFVAVLEGLHEEVCEAVAVVQRVALRFHFVELEVLLVDEVISELVYWQQTLQTGIHVAVVAVVLQANYPISQLEPLLAIFSSLLRFSFRYGGLRCILGGVKHIL